MDQIALAELTRRVHEASTWCDPRVNMNAVASCLRTLPNHCYPFCNRYFMVEDVVRARAEALGVWSNDVGEPPLAAPPGAGSGRVMAFMPDIYLHEQLEIGMSDGFFNEQCTPPTDTWLAYLRKAPGIEHESLLFWVPEKLIELAESGSAVNSTDCLVWFDTMDFDLARAWREVSRAK